MERIFFTGFTMCVIVFVLFLISVFACFYIFADSQKRRMNTKLWVFLVAVFHVFALVTYAIVKKPKYTKIDDELLEEGHKKSSVPALLVSIFVCILAAIMNFMALSYARGFEMEKYELTSATVSIETVKSQSPEISKWIEECNKDKNHDVFILRNDYCVGELLYVKGRLASEKSPEYTERDIDSVRKEICLKLPAENTDPAAYNITYFKTVNVYDEQYFEDDCYSVWGNHEEIVVCYTVTDIDALVG